VCGVRVYVRVVCVCVCGWFREKPALKDGRESANSLQVAGTRRLQFWVFSVLERHKRHIKFQRSHSKRVHSSPLESAPPPRHKRQPTANQESTSRLFERQSRYADRTTEFFFSTFLAIADQNRNQRNLFAKYPMCASLGNPRRRAAFCSLTFRKVPKVGQKNVSHKEVLSSPTKRIFTRCLEHVRTSPTLYNGAW
jgi:hypothetical protein